MSEPACADLTPVETVHENPWFAVRNRGGHFTLEYRDTHVTVFALIDAAAVVMVRVRRPVIADSPLELPGGTGAPSEEPAAIAARELGEETGIRIADLARFRPLAPICISSTRMPRLMYVFGIDIAQVEFDARAPHDDEIDAVEALPIGEIAQMMSDGRIYVSVPLAVLGRHLASRAAAAEYCLMEKPR